MEAALGKQKEYKLYKNIDRMFHIKVLRNQLINMWRVLLCCMESNFSSDSVDVT